MSTGHIIRALLREVNGVMSIGQNATMRYGLEDNAGCSVRRMRAQVDTGDREPAKLSLQEVSVNPVEQGRR